MTDTMHSAPSAIRSRPAGGAARTEPDGTAAVAFLCGLFGLLVGNLILGPLAIALGGAALRRGTGRRGRAMLAVALGMADLALFAVLAAHSWVGGLMWHFASR